MLIGIIARAKQGDILAALETRGWTQRQGANFLGMNESDFGRLINMKWVPKEFSPELTIKLYELTNKTPEELFPMWAREEDFLKIPKVSKRFAKATPQLLQGFASQHLLPNPEEAFSKKEVREVIERALHTLSPREELIVKRLIMEEEDPKSIGRDFCLTGSRIYQIADKALRKLRHPMRSKELRECFFEK